MLDSLQHDDQVGEFISFLLADEGALGVLGIVFETELLEDSEDDLRVDASHSEGLHEPAETALDVAVLVVYSLEIFEKNASTLRVLASNDLGDAVDFDSAGVEEDFGSDLLEQRVVGKVISFFYCLVESLWFEVCFLDEVFCRGLLIKHVLDILHELSRVISGDEARIIPHQTFQDVRDRAEAPLQVIGCLSLDLRVLDQQRQRAPDDVLCEWLAIVYHEELRNIFWPQTQQGLAQEVDLDV